MKEIANHLLLDCLVDLEARIDPEIEVNLRREWIDFSNGRSNQVIFNPRRVDTSPSQVEWPEIAINTALVNQEAMAFQQFHACSDLLANGAGELMSVRCNYGTGILPSLFGLEMFVMDQELNTLPTIRPLNDLARIEAILDAGIPDLNTGYGKRVLEMGEKYLDWMAHFPKIQQFIQVYHPDLQGPLDVCELIFGSTLFTTLYDRPELVHAMLNLVCATYTRFMNAWFELHPPRPEGNAHWGLFHRGAIMLRDDSAMNLSKSMVQEFILPYDQRLLTTFDGGAVHFCGKGDHYIEDLSRLSGISAINLTQPELNNMEQIYTHTIDKGINLLALQRKAAEEAVRSQRDLHHRVHVS
jgi:hypothetical protein